MIQERDEGVLLTPKAAAAARTWESIIGCVGYEGPRKSLKEMDEAIG